MRVAVEFVTLKHQQAFLVWLAEALKDSPQVALDSISFMDAEEANVGAFSEGIGDE